MTITISAVYENGVLRPAQAGGVSPCCCKTIGG